MGYNPMAGRVVVVGSGIAGLFSARVLSDHFQQVLVVDRDEIPDGPQSRAGVPQGRHLHVLLPGGLDIGCQLFPALAHDLQALGAVPCTGGRDFFFFRPEGKSYSLPVYRPEPLPGGVVYAMSRPLLEHCLRRRVEALPNVEVRYRCLVKRPLTDASRITGVSLSDGEDIAADLVVDAAGKNPPTVRWLGDLGFEAPEESVVNCDFAYASALLRPANPDAFGGVGFFVLPRPDSQYNTRGAYLVRIEGDNWLAGLGGRFGDYPPTDLKGWRDYGRSLAWPIWDELVDTSEPVTEPVPFRFPRSVRRHFERLERFPDGLVPLGDGICHFNPVYGQGMSVAACQARALGQVLERRSQEATGLTGIALEFFPEAHEVTRTPWAVAAAADFQDARTTGDFPAEEMANLAMLQVVLEAGITDPEAAQLAADIFGLVRPLTALRESPLAEKVGYSTAPTSPL